MKFLVTVVTVSNQHVITGEMAFLPRIGERVSLGGSKAFKVTDIIYSINSGNVTAVPVTIVIDAKF